MPIDVQIEGVKMREEEREKLIREYGKLGISLIPFHESGENLPEFDRDRLSKIRKLLSMSHDEILKALAESMPPR